MYYFIEVCSPQMMVHKDTKARDTAQLVMRYDRIRQELDKKLEELKLKQKQSKLVYHPTLSYSHDHGDYFISVQMKKHCSVSNYLKPLFAII